ncbi:MAG: hypothetical protein ACM3VW_07970 [Bacteroidota bacterium]
MPTAPASILRTVLLTSVAIFASVSLGQPETDGQLVCGGRLRITAPEGWQLSRAGEAGAILRPPAPEGQPIEIVGWDVPRGGEPSPLAAATAQETLLVRTGPYARRGTESYKTAAGATGLLMSGQVRSTAGKLQDAAFAAFCEGGRYYIVGTFVGEGSGPILEGPFGQVLKTLRFETLSTATPAAAQPADPGPVAAAPVNRSISAAGLATAPPSAPVAPGPVPTTVALPPPMPIVSTPAAAPGLDSKPVTPGTRGTGLTVADAPGAPPAVGGVAPPPTSVETDAFISFASPLGFTLEHPAGWKTSVSGGRIEIAAPPGDGSALPAAMVIIWPLAGVTEKQDPLELARRVLSTWDAVGGRVSRLRGRIDNDCAMLAGQIGDDSAQRRVVASCHVNGDTALVSALVARPEEFEARLPALTRTLASFSGGPWWTSERSVDGSTLWRDTAAGALETTIPNGWKARGGVQNYNGSWSVYLELVSTDARHLCVTWQQPVTPVFRDLTLVLRNLGWQEGDKYVANPGDQALRLLTRLSPQDFLTKYWLPNGPLRLQGAVIDRLESSADATALVNGNNPAAIRALLHGSDQEGPRERLCLITTADAPVRMGANCWQTAVLQAEAPQGHLDEAVSVLRSVVTRAKPAPEGPAAAQTPLFQLLDGARRALAALPAPGDGAMARNVLPALNPRGEGQLWLLSPGALQVWQRAARRLESDGAGTDTKIPELQPEFWQ